MKNGVDFKELKEIEKKILKGIKVQDSITNIKTVAAFDIAYSDKKYHCIGVVYDLETNKEIEVSNVESEEIMPYSPSMVAFREGPAIIDAYRNIKNKPDVLIVKGNGAINKYKVGLASYVGVLVNKPCIGVTKELTSGKLEEDNILFENEIRGKAIRTKEYANPIYISPGHGIDLNLSVEIIKKLIIEPYKLPLPLHLAHKYVNRKKKE